METKKRFVTKGLPEVTPTDNTKLKTDGKGKMINSTVRGPDRQEPQTTKTNGDEPFHFPSF
ncbi:MAG: hypothetical protein ACYC6X_00085 [Minisyncoccota bacterium]